MHTNSYTARAIYRQTAASRNASAYYTRRKRWMRKPRGPRALLRTGRSEGDLYHFFLQQQQVYWDQHLRRQADQRKMLMWLEGQHEEFRIRRTSRDLTTRVRATYVRHSNLGPFGGKTS